MQPRPIVETVKSVPSVRCFMLFSYSTRAMAYVGVTALSNKPRKIASLPTELQFGNVRTIFNFAQQLAAYGVSEVLIAPGRHHETFGTALHIAAIIVGEITDFILDGQSVDHHTAAQRHGARLVDEHGELAGDGLAAIARDIDDLTR